MRAAGQPLELILARNLVACMTVPGFVTDAEGAIVYCNEAGDALLGRRFEESGRLSREEWNAIGPLDEHGEPLREPAMPLTTALQRHVPAFGRFRIRTDSSGLLMIEACALPLLGPGGPSGVVVVFWPDDDGGAG